MRLSSQFELVANAYNVAIGVIIISCVNVTVKQVDRVMFVEFILSSDRPASFFLAEIGKRIVKFA